MKNVDTPNFDQRNSGIALIGDLPWGSHFCQLYETEDDVFDILSPYLNAGLKANELCGWITSEQFGVKDIEGSLKPTMPDIESYTRSGQMRIVNCEFGHKDVMKFEEMISSMMDKALSQGFNGLRLVVTANPPSVIDHKEFFAKAIDAINKHNIVAAFAYQRGMFDALGLMDIVKNHRFALIKDTGEWQVLESSEARMVRNVLKRNEEKLHSVFSNMSEGFAYHKIVLDEERKPIDYIFLEVNEAFENLTKLKGQDIIGIRATEAIPGLEKDPADWIGRYGKVALTGKSTQFESFAAALDRWYSISAFSPHKGYFAVIFTDITERKRNEFELDRLASFPTLNPNPVLEVDASGKISFANPAAQTILRDLGLDETGTQAFLPPDMSDILKKSDKLKDSSVSREIHVKDKIFGETIFLSPKLGVARIYAYDITDVKRFANALKESEAKYRNIVETANEGIWMADANRITTYVNNKMAEMLGYEVSEMIGRSGLDFMPEHSKAISDANFIKRRRGEKDSYELELLHKNRRTLWTYINATPLFDENGEYIGSLSMISDVTNRKIMEEEQRQSEERLNRAEQIADLGSWELDIANDILTWSDQVFRIFGLKEQEFGATYENFLDAIHPDDRKTVDDMYVKSLREGTDGYEIEHRVIRKSDGEIRVVHEKCVHQRDRSGKIIRSIGMIQDITDRKRSEEKLRETRDYLEKLIDFANAPIIVWDPEFRITRFNNAFERLTGYGADEVLGKDLRILFPKSSEEQSLVKIVGTFLGEFWESVEIPILRKDGAERMVLWNSANIYANDDKTLIATIAQGNDITERKLSEKRLQKTTNDLQRSNEELEQFAYIASHDLQEPLRMVASYLQLIEKRYEDELDNDAREFIGFAVGGAKHMQSMIEALLSYSRLATDRKSFELIDTMKAVKQAISNLKVAIDESGAIVTYDKLLPVLGDQAQIVQLFQNLIINGINFRSIEVPQIHISASKEESESVFSIRDNGIGFSDQYADRIFRIFEKLKAGSDSGTGIGLAICKRIVERHGGKIWAKSKPDKGSTFCFSIPRKGGDSHGRRI